MGGRNEDKDGRKRERRGEWGWVGLWMRSLGAEQDLENTPHIVGKQKYVQKVEHLRYNSQKQKLFVMDIDFFFKYPSNVWPNRTPPKHKMCRPDNPFVIAVTPVMPRFFFSSKNSAVILILFILIFLFTTSPIWYSRCEKKININNEKDPSKSKNILVVWQKIFEC